MRRLNVGCGPNHIKTGWYNIDIQPFPGIDEARDATLPLDDLSPLKYVYCEHFLEHLSLGGAIQFLRNSVRALVPGGRIRLSTPSLEWTIATHFDLRDTKEQNVVAATMAINRAFRGWGHKFIWSKPMLREALSAAGFKDISFCSYNQSEDPDLAGLEEHGDYFFHRGWPSVWIAEGVREKQTVEQPAFFARCENDFGRFVRDLEPELRGLAAEADQLRTSREALQAECAEMRAEIASLEGEVVKYRAEIASLEGGVAKCRAEIASLEGEVAKYRLRLEKLTADDNYKGQLINSIKSSITWKVTSPFWRLETRRQQKAKQRRQG
jgi:predicted SAM-dependent methyltransferase